MSGKEKDFIATFGAFAEWVFDRNLGAEKFTYCKISSNRAALLPFGPWESILKIEEWRKLPDFKEFFVKAKGMCDEVTPLTMKSMIHLKR